MGHYHILSVSEDALMLNRERVTELEAAFGSAIVSLCGGTPIVNMSGPNPVVVESRDVLNCGNAVHRAGDVHATDTALFAWSQAKLKPLRDMSLEELVRAEEMVAAALKSKRGAT